MVDRIDFSEIPKDRGYDSAFESDAEKKKRRERFQGLESQKKRKEKVANKRQLEEELIKEEGKVHRYHRVSLDAFSRHKEYINNYLLYYGGSKKEFERDKSRDKRDIDVIRENHQFLWNEEEDEENTWEKRLAKKYYDKLFKEYCIADLSRYKENKIGMRWRIDKEVIAGKGQFICGNKKCDEKEGLRSWEVNFGYVEQGLKKNALVKLRLCPDCSYKLNYHHKRKEIFPKKRDKSSKSATEVEVTEKKKRKKSDHESSPGSSKDKTDNSRDKEEEKEKEKEQEEGVWSQPFQATEEKSREDEFDDYFADMFL